MCLVGVSAAGLMSGSGSHFDLSFGFWFILCSALGLIQDSIIKTRLGLSIAQISLRWLDRYVLGYALHGCGRALCLYSGSGVARLSWRRLAGRFAARFLVFANGLYGWSAWVAGVRLMLDRNKLGNNLIKSVTRPAEKHRKPGHPFRITLLIIPKWV